MQHVLKITLVVCGFALLLAPTVAFGLSVADYVDLTIARLELAEAAWRDESRSPTQAEEDDLFELFATTSEVYMSFSSENERGIEAYLGEHPHRRAEIEALSQAIEQWIQASEAE